MPPDPLVSIILPAYNAAPYIRETLDSIFAQTYPHIEVIVVDDGSTDDTGNIVLSYGHPLHYLRHDHTGSHGVPRNRGLGLSSGNLIASFDSDDLMLPHKIEASVEFLRRHPHVPAVFTDYQNFSNGQFYPNTHFDTCPTLRSLFSQHADGHHLVLDPATASQLLLQENFAITSGLVLQRTALLQLGPYDKTLRAAVDFEFHYRLASAFPIGLIDRVGFHRRLHGANVTANHKLLLENQIKCHRKLLARETSRLRRKLLRRGLAICHLDLGYHLIGHDDAGAFAHTLRSSLFRQPINYSFIRNLAKIALRRLGYVRTRQPSEPAL